MKVFIVGTKKKGNLFKDGRYYKKEHVAKRVAARQQDFIKDVLKVFEVEIETEAETIARLKSELKEAYRLIKTAKILISPSTTDSDADLWIEKYESKYQ